MGDAVVGLELYLGQCQVLTYVHPAIPHDGMEYEEHL